MKPESVNPNVRNYLKTSQFTNDADIDRCLRLGLLAVHATAFANTIAERLGANAVYILQEFYRNFLGEYQHICVSHSFESCAIRLCDQTSANAVDGVELVFLIQPSLSGRQSIKLYKLSATFDTTTRTLLQEYI